MPIFDVTAPDGTKYTIEGPPGSTVEQAIERVKAQHQPSVAEDVAKTIPAGVARGVQSMVEPAIAAPTKLAAKAQGIDVPEGFSPLTMIPKIAGQFMGTKPVPDLYKPQTLPGEYANTISEFAPGALIGGAGGVIPKLAKYAAIPGIASEAAGQQFKGSPYEGYVRIAGALAGTGLGAATGPLSAAIANRAAAGSTAGKISQDLGVPITSGAVGRLGADVAADKLTPALAAAKAGELGPEAMVLDLGRQARLRAEGIAAQPGPGQSRILDAVEQRTGTFGSGTADRVQQTLDREMGQSENVVDLQNRVAAKVDSIAGPLYRQVMDAHPVVDVPASITSRPAVASAMKDAGTLARNYGEVIDETARPSLKYWDYVKKALDMRIQAYYRSGPAAELQSAQKADLGGLQSARTALVDHLDNLTKGEYARARQVAATKPQLNEAMQFGRDAFNTRLLPEEFIHELSQMSIPERAMAQVGFRRELDRLVQATRNEGANARRILDTNHVQQKIEALYGPQVARAIEQRIRAETTFQEATQDIARNSRTAVRQALRQDTAEPSTSAALQTTLTGLPHAAARGIANWARGFATSRTRNALGEMLAASGPQRDAVVNALLGYNARVGANAARTGAAIPSAIGQIADILGRR